MFVLLIQFEEILIFFYLLHLFSAKSDGDNDSDQSDDGDDSNQRGIGSRKGNLI